MSTPYELYQEQQELQRKNAEANRLLALEPPPVEKTGKPNNWLILAISGVFFLWGTWGMIGHSIQQGRFSREGATTEGIVVRTYRRKTTSTADYIYRVGEKQYERTSRNYMGPSANSANSVSVRYLPSDPTQSEIVGRENHWSKVLLYVLGTFLGGIGLASVFSQLRKPAEIAYDPSEPYRTVTPQKLAPTDSMPIGETEPTRT